MIFQRHFSILFLLAIFLPGLADATICPAGFIEELHELTDPTNLQTYEFSCRNIERREFLHRIDDTKFLATVFTDLDPVSGEENFRINTLNIYQNDKIIQYIKYSHQGELERFETYENEKITRRFVKDATKYEEIAYTESEPGGKTSRECIYEANTNLLIEELRSSGQVLELSFSDLIEDELYVNYTITYEMNGDIQKIDNAGNEKLLKIKTVDHVGWPKNKFDVTKCFNGSLFPENYFGEVLVKGKKFTLSENGISRETFEEILKEKDEGKLFVFLEKNSTEVSDLTAELPDTTGESNNTPIEINNTNNPTTEPIPPAANESNNYGSTGNQK